MLELEKKIREFKKKLRPALLTKEWLERTIISLGLYGRISGVLGPFIIANFNGRMIIRLRPKDFKTCQSPAAIANRKNMAAANKFAMFLKSTDVIYNVWKKAKIKGNNPFTRLIKYNKKHLINNCPSPANTITPEGYNIYIEDIINVQRNGIIKISRDYCPAAEEKMVIVMTAIDPKRRGVSDFECIEINCSPVKAGQAIKLKEWQKTLCRNYNRYIIYTAVIRQNGKKVEWSNSNVLEAAFDFGADYDKAESMGYGQVKSAAGNLQLSEAKSQKGSSVICKLMMVEDLGPPGGRLEAKNRGHGFNS